jgi:hypothetical protein
MFMLESSFHENKPGDATATEVLMTHLLGAIQSSSSILVWHGGKQNRNSKR